MPAQFEEMIVAPYPFDIKQLLPDFGKRHLHLPARRFVAAAHISITLRRGQRPAIQLAVRCQRPPRQFHIRRRHHVLRETRLQGRT
ncbi:hypothetical protein ALO86_200133 [Pseudomonas syringae pv. berberidis]|nr:hypothetical protein ALO86_200133 [Pseudomonas syringae pv. berberidis]